MNTPEPPTLLTNFKTICQKCPAASVSAIAGTGSALTTPQMTGTGHMQPKRIMGGAKVWTPPRLKKRKDRKYGPYCVYLILLDHRSFTDGFRKEFDDVNPGRDPDKQCYYVGQTCLHPRDRFEQHKAGKRASRVVRKYGILVAYERCFSCHSREEAERREMEMAEKLRSSGHGVWAH